jgi:hypothetical protein
MKGDRKLVTPPPPCFLQVVIPGRLRRLQVVWNLPVSNR